MTTKSGSAVREAGGRWPKASLAVGKTDQWENPTKREEIVPGATPTLAFKTGEGRAQIIKNL